MVTDRITFLTYPEVDSVSVGSIKTLVKLGESIKYQYQTPFGEGEINKRVQFQVNGSITTSWSESSTLGNSIVLSSTSQYTNTVSGGIEVEGFKLGNGQSTSLSSTVTKTCNESKTTVSAGSDTKSITVNDPILLSTEKPTITLIEIIYTNEQEITANYYSDANEDGVADSSTLAVVTCLARQKPHAAYKAMIDGPLP